MEIKNITLAVPKTVLSKFKEIAFRRQKSVSELMIEIMEETILSEEGYHAARGSHLHGLDTGTDLKTDGAVSWKRDDLHDDRELP